jgi:GNAT superfamily N-acetyltransferase
MIDRVTLRDAVPEDLNFLAYLYGDTRRKEASVWGWPREQLEIFLQMQFDAQYRFYRASFPHASDRIICADAQAIGRMLVDEHGAEKRLVDIALLDAYRNRGIGTSLLQQLLQECKTQGRTLQLQTLQGNPAARLYLRLGFVECGADQMYAQFQWVPSEQRERV